MSTPVDLSSCVIRRIAQEDNPNIAQAQPKCKENEEIAGESVHLILEQHYIGIGCLDISSSLLLSLTIRVVFGFLHCCSYFLQNGSSVMEELPWGVWKRNLFYMCLILLF